MKKKALSLALAMGMALTLLPGTAFAAGSGSTLVKNAGITLSEQYLFAGRNNDWYVEEAYYAPPVVTDLDGDGKLEVLNAAYSLSVMDAATGTEKWRINAGKDRSSEYSDGGNVVPGQVFNTFLVQDIDGDGKQEIVIGYGNGTVSVLDNQGYFKPGWPQKPTSSSIRSLAADDLNGDGKKEIIVGVGIANPVSVWVYHCDGTVAEGWPQLDSSQNGTYQKSEEYITKTAWSAGVYGNGITTGDLNGDGLPEIIVPTDTSFIDAYYYDGSLVKASDIYGGRAWGKIALYEDYAEEIACKNEGWGWNDELDTRAQTYRSELASAGTAYTDVDGDGISEIVITSMMADRTTFTTQGNDTATIADSKYMTAFILNQDRSRYVNQELGFDWTSAPNELTSEISGPLKSYETTSVYGHVTPVPVCVDLDGDGYQEILFNSFDGKLHCFSLDKSEWCFTLPKTTSTIYEYPSQPVCVDIDGDGTMEVIFASWTDCEDSNKSTGTYAGSTGVNGALYVLNCNGGLLASMDLHNGYTTWEDRNNPNAGFTNGVLGAPAVQDVDGDGKYEILVNTRYYALCAYEINVNTPGVSTFGGFTDVKGSDFYADPVLWAVDNNITQGTGSNDYGNIFSPGNICTHVEIITFLWRAAGKPISAAQAPVAVESYYEDAVKWASEKGMIDAGFNPSAPCTRADTVNYMWIAAGSPITEASSFTDVSADAAYSAAVNWAVSTGITQGTGENKFSPNLTCTRGQIVTFLHRDRT